MHISEAIVFPADVYGSEIKEKPKLNVSENKVLRNTFGTNVDAESGHGRISYNEEVSDLNTARTVTPTGPFSV
jgi:hypothetical protein